MTSRRGGGGWSETIQIEIKGRRHCRVRSAAGVAPVTLVRPHAARNVRSGARVFLPRAMCSSLLAVGSEEAAVNVRTPFVLSVSGSVLQSAAFLEVLRSSAELGPYWMRADEPAGAAIGGT